MRRPSIHGRSSSRGTNLLLVTSAVLILYVSALAAMPDTRTWADAASFAEQLLLPVAVASSAFLIIAWRIQPSAALGWLTAATTMIGLQALPMLAPSPDGSGLADQGVLSTAIVGGVILLVLVYVARRRRLVIDPTVVGICVGVGLLAFRGVWSVLSLPTAQSDTATAYGSLALLLISVALAAAIHRASTLPLGSTRLSVTVVAWSVAAALGAMQWTERPAWAIVAIGAGLLASTLALSTAFNLLRQTLRSEREAVLHLQEQLHAMRSRVEQLHEVKGTIAGIASATDLIRHEERLTRQHRDRLEDMLAQEAARLQRLVQASPVARVASLDAIIRPLVLARQVQGQDVEWIAPDIPLQADVDELSEVVNILLHNAAEHAPGARVQIYTRVRDGNVQLVVADSGAGVPEELRDHIFEWGYRSETSAGQGVGLALARRMMARTGSCLRLDEDHVAGAAFVLDLTQPDQEDSCGSAGLLIG